MYSYLTVPVNRLQNATFKRVESALLRFQTERTRSPVNRLSAEEYACPSRFRAVQISAPFNRKLLQGCATLRLVSRVEHRRS